MLSCVIVYLFTRELSYKWSERLLVSVGSLCVCDSREGKVKFEADLASFESECNVGVAMT